MSVAPRGPVKRTPAIEDSTRVAGWLTTVPELRSRPALLAYLREHKSLQRAFFNAINNLENVALIPDPRIAIECLVLYWDKTRARFETNWKGRLAEDRGEDNQLWAELHGALRNVYKNMRVKAGKTAQGFCEHDVVREVVAAPGIHFATVDPPGQNVFWSREGLTWKRGTP